MSATGSLTASTSYDAWGNAETSGGLSANTPFGFAGAYTDPSGLIYLIHRYYDPSTGQFVNVDPLVEETGQAYAYTRDDPVNGVDPDGDGAHGPSGTASESCNGQDIQVCTASASSGCSVATNPQSSILGSTPYGGPSVTHAGPTIEIYSGSLVYTISSSITITGPDTNPYLSIESDGTLDISVPGGSAQVSPDGAENGLIGVPGTNGISLCFQGGGGICYTAPSASYDLGEHTKATVTVTAELGPAPPINPVRGLEAVGTGVVIGAIVIGCGGFDVVTGSAVCPVPGT